MGSTVPRVFLYPTFSRCKVTDTDLSKPACRVLADERRDLDKGLRGLSLPPLAGRQEELETASPSLLVGCKQVMRPSI